MLFLEQYQRKFKTRVITGTLFVRFSPHLLTEYHYCSVPWIKLVRLTWCHVVQTTSAKKVTLFGFGQLGSNDRRGGESGRDGEEEGWIEIVCEETRGLLAGLQRCEGEKLSPITANTSQSRLFISLSISCLISPLLTLNVFEKLSRKYYMFIRKFL